MTEKERELYKKCIRKRKTRTLSEYESDHEYNISANEFDDRER